MLSGTIPRNKSANSRREAESSEPNLITASEIPRQVAAESNPKPVMNRRAYLGTLLPSFGKLLVRGLRSVENIKRDIEEYSSSKPS
jgi:hypothetical protein